jgi:hypothetical protein
MGDNCLSPSQVKDLFHQVHLHILAMQQRREQITGNDPDGDLEDSVIIREELEKEDSVSSEIVEIVGTLLRHHPDSSLTAFQEILYPMVGELIQKNRSTSERQLAICMFDDIVQYTKQKSLSLFDNFLPFLLEYCLDTHPGVRQAACYGLGIVAQEGGEKIKPYIRRIVELLIQVITSKDSRSEKYAAPTENAISSIGRILRYQSDQLGDRVAELTNMWVSWLPITTDDEEARTVHELLCWFLKNNNPHIFGNNYSNLPKILNIFASILFDNRELVTPGTSRDIKELLARMQQLPAEFIQKAFSVLPQNEQEVLKRALNE